MRSPSSTERKRRKESRRRSRRHGCSIGTPARYGLTDPGLTPRGSAGPLPGLRRYHEGSPRPPPLRVDRRRVWALAQEGREQHIPTETVGDPSEGPGQDGGASGLSLARQEVYDAEFTAIAYGLLILARRGEVGHDFTLFTDSQAAVRRWRAMPPGRVRR